MNTNLVSARALAEGVCRVAGREASVDVAVFPPFPYLLPVGEVLRAHGGTVRLGAQDVHWQKNGAFTGEVSVEMLVDCGVQVALTGHSERRHLLGETDECVNGKTRAVLDAGLACVLCVGETLEQRQAGQTDAVNLHQIVAGLAGVRAERAGRLLTIAYEPVWAIGTGRTATPADAQAAQHRIRQVLADLFGQNVAGEIRIQYGGSVKASNAAELFAQPDVDGGLIGGASLSADEFGQIVRAAGASRRRAGG